MSEFVINEPSSTPQELLTLFCLLGETVFMIQLLEDALSHSITLKKDVKKPRFVPKARANEILKVYRTLPLGKAIKAAKSGKNLFGSVAKCARGFFA